MINNNNDDDDDDDCVHRPDMTFEVGWALNNNYLSIVFMIPARDILDKRKWVF